MKKKITLALGLAAAAVAIMPAMGASAAADGETIAGIASGNEDFSTLVAALGAADLVGSFDECSDGPFTVLAPTNDAFAAALASLGLTAEELLADTELLTSVLTYHVIEGAVLAETVVTLDSAPTLNGADVSIAVVDGGVVLNDSVNVVTTDIEACNGVIHVIDAVLLPPADEAPTTEAPAPDATLAATGPSTESTVALMGGALLAGGLGILLISRRRATS
jgi:transforming growth factor-beta-induced protein